MNDQDQQGIDHPSVGAALFEYCHCEGDEFFRVGFSMRVGDNPDFWKARLLMPGAEFIGVCVAGFDFDTGAIEPDPEWPTFEARVRAGRSVFLVTIRARNLVDARRRCAEIGGLRIWGDREPMPMERVRLRLRWLWERRPVVRWRSPLDLFG